jgi:hypothetical protein
MIAMGQMAMTTQASTTAMNRKKISEALLAERLGLHDDWIERWEEDGVLREESCAPDQLPYFVRRIGTKKELKEVEEKIEQLVVAGCQRAVVYFCIAQLSPFSDWVRTGGESRMVPPGGRLTAGDEDYSVQRSKRPLLPREDLVVVASKAKAARKQIHRCQRELSLVAEAFRRSRPMGLTAWPEHPDEALSRLKESLSWVAVLADSYVAPMETTLLKSKGLIYLTLYTSLFADKTQLRSSKVNQAIKDGRRSSESVRATREISAPGNALAELASKVTGKSWSTSDLQEKLRAFKSDHPRLYTKLSRKLKELHDFSSR